MQQVQDLADERLLLGCIYCDGPEQTRDHVPSRILLDTPYPDNLPVVGCCLDCNRSFSLDEEYFACLLEVGISGSSDPEKVSRASIANILARKTSLKARIESAKRIIDSQIHFDIEKERFENVILKLARGHMAFENSQECRKKPKYVWWGHVGALSQERRNDFESMHFVKQLGEIGSRASQRLMVLQYTLRSINGKEEQLSQLVYDWVDVQEGRYRYLAIDDCGELIVRIVISDFLACEVLWSEKEYEEPPDLGDNDGNEDSGQGAEQ